MTSAAPTIAVLMPCYQEETAIARVVRDFKAALPDAALLRMPIAEIATPYRQRPPGSRSKLSTFKDGFRILWMIGKLVKEERPLGSFSVTAAVLALASVALAWPIFATYMETGLVPRLPTAVLSTGLMILAFLALACGLILETVTRGRREAKRMRYLDLAAPAFDPATVRGGPP